MNRLEQIRRAHASARPKHDNPAWLHTHNDLTYVLGLVDKMQAVVNAASIFDHASEGDGDTTDEHWELSEAIKAYRATL